MTAEQDRIPVFHRPVPMVRRVRPEQPWEWLAAGWRDFLRTPRASLAYGLGIAATSVLIVATLGSLNRLALLFPMLAGFALMCPFLAVGLYAIARSLEAGKPARWRTVADVARHHGDQVGLMGAFLMLIHVAWVHLATLLFLLFFAQIPVGLADMIDLLLRTPEGFAFLLLGSLIGAALAGFTFSVSVVALPMLIDGEAGIFSAVATSWTAVRVNRSAMSLWAAIIVGATLLGFVTGFLGFVILMPLLGYASWHAYGDVVIRHGTVPRQIQHQISKELRS